MKATLETVTGVTINRDIDTGSMRRMQLQQRRSSPTRRRLISLWTDISMKQSQHSSC